MAKITKSVELSKEAQELSEAIVGLVRSVKEKAKDGLSPAEVASALTENVGALMAGLGGLDQLDDEVAADRGATVRVAALMAADLVDVLVPGPKPQAPQA